MLAIGPPPVAPVFCRNRCRGSPSTVCWMLPNVFRKQVLPLMTVVSCRSEAAPRTSLNCDTVLNPHLGFLCEHRAHWLQSQRRKRSEIWRQRHCVTLQRCIIQMATMSTSQPTRLPFQEPSVTAGKREQSLKVFHRIEHTVWKIHQCTPSWKVLNHNNDWAEISLIKEDKPSEALASNSCLTYVRRETSIGSDTLSPTPLIGSQRNATLDQWAVENRNSSFPWKSRPHCCTSQESFKQMFKNLNSGLSCVDSAGFPCSCVASLWVFWLPPTDQRHDLRG